MKQESTGKSTKLLCNMLGNSNPINKTKIRVNTHLMFHLNHRTFLVALFCFHSYKHVFNSKPFSHMKCTHTFPHFPHKYTFQLMHHLRWSVFCIRVRNSEYSTVMCKYINELRIYLMNIAFHQRILSAMRAIVCCGLGFWIHLHDH